mmetsp:Transcript_9170/g.11841  ORF Transcript_9170/g.11841 Transcript_9170/m.11841 type:complete len:106 (-) Transcript_9170:68-385(-)
MVIDMTIPIAITNKIIICSEKQQLICICIPDFTQSILYLPLTYNAETKNYQTPFTLKYPTLNANKSRIFYEFSPGCFKFQLNAAQSFFCSSGNGYRVDVVIISSE